MSLTSYRAAPSRAKPNVFVVRAAADGVLREAYIGGGSRYLNP